MAQVVNGSGLARVVLLIRFWHPELPRGKRSAVLAKVLAERAEAYRDRWVPPLTGAMKGIEDALPLYTEGRATAVVCPGCGPEGMVELALRGAAGCGERATTAATAAVTTIRFVCTRCGRPLDSPP